MVIMNTSSRADIEVLQEDEELGLGARSLKGIIV
jgi:hypothetical protein